MDSQQRELLEMKNLTEALVGVSHLTFHPTS